MNNLKKDEPTVDFAALYDGHDEYAARRISGSYEQLRVLLEATEFKIPNLVNLIPSEQRELRSVLEIGCATGELIAHFPVVSGGRRVGCDISSANILAATVRFPNVEFTSSDFFSMNEFFDAVILSDLLEHVEDDVGFLRHAATIAHYTLVNLPLEDNYLNRRRNYGADDSSGHLRFYTIEEGLNLFRLAGLHVVEYKRIWAHETKMDEMRRQLRRQFTGQALNGGFLIRMLKRALLCGAYAIKPLGRILFPSNLFAIAISDKH
jgi:SAM-dependent methyltransferase